MTAKRIQWIDAAKGIAILIVALVHAMSPVMEGYTLMSRFYRFLYWMVNPMFMLLAGLLSHKLLTAQVNRPTVLKNRAIQLMVPYGTWAVIYLALKLVFKDFIRFEPAPVWTLILGNNPAGQLWFLYVLFLISTLALLVRRNTVAIWCALALVTSFFAPLIPDSIRFPGINLTYPLFQLGFYFLGLYLSRHRATAFSHGYLAMICGVLGLGQLVLFLLDIEPWYLRLPGTLCVCYALIYCLSKLPEGRFTNALSYLGQRSMDIYILHAPILHVGRVILKPLLGNFPWAYALCMTVCSVAAALLISHFIVEKIPPLRFLLLGKQGK